MGGWAGRGLSLPSAPVEYTLRAQQEQSLAVMPLRDISRQLIPALTPLSGCLPSWTGLGLLPCALCRTPGAGASLSSGWQHHTGLRHLSSGFHAIVGTTGSKEGLSG